MSEKTERFIESHWDECIKENRNDTDTLIGMPYPYTVPAVGFFDCMYYWDTYFTNKGLECSGRYAQAKNNTDNMLYLVNRYGFMPNGSEKRYLNHSQPPFLSIMVKDVYEHYKDEVCLSGAYMCLEKEYNFWMTERMSPIGLNTYGGKVAGNDWTGWAQGFKNRVGFMPEGNLSDIGRHFHLTCESGWDINPRWDFEAYNYAPVDLNSLLYMLEDNMRYFSLILKNGRTEEWGRRAEKRRELMYKYMDNGDGLFLDYNFKRDSLSKVFSAASFYPMCAGLAENEQAAAMVRNLGRLEAEYGILSCEKNDDIKGNYQWGYPNGWACLQYMAFTALEKYGYIREAVRIADKYVRLVDKVFEETGNLWEKYNVVEGNINVSNEYDMPKMMGWSAGVYLAAERFLKFNFKIREEV